MLIRFLDGKENIYQIDSHKTPVLVLCEGEEELKYFHQITNGGCLVSIPKSFNEETMKRCYEKLNTKDEPKNLK